MNGVSTQSDPWLTFWTLVAAAAAQLDAQEAQADDTDTQKRPAGQAGRD